MIAGSARAELHPDDPEVRLAEGRQIVLQAGEHRERHLGKRQDRRLGDQVHRAPGGAVDPHRRDADHPSHDQVLQPHQHREQQAGDGHAAAEPRDLPEHRAGPAPAGTPPVGPPHHQGGGGLGDRALHHQAPGAPSVVGGGQRRRTAGEVGHDRAGGQDPMPELAQQERQVGGAGGRDRQDEAQCREQRRHLRRAEGGRDRPSDQGDHHGDERSEPQRGPEHGIGHRRRDLAGARDGAHQARVGQDPPELGEGDGERERAEGRRPQGAGEQREDGEGEEEVGAGAGDRPEDRGPGLFLEIGRRALGGETIERVVELARWTGVSAAGYRLAHATTSVCSRLPPRSARRRRLRRTLSARSVRRVRYRRSRSRAGMT